MEASNKIVNPVKLSARNILEGRVDKVIPGTVNSEVILMLKNGIQLTAIITNSSKEELKVEVGMNASAIIKASWILIAKCSTKSLMVSAQNKLKGAIVQIETGHVNSEIVIDLKSGIQITAIITNRSVYDMNLKLRDNVIAFFKASSVILGVE